MNNLKNKIIFIFIYIGYFASGFCEAASTSRAMPGNCSAIKCVETGETDPSGNKLLGSQRQLHKNVSVREVRRSVWDTHALVQIVDTGAPNCSEKPDPDSAISRGDWISIQTDPNTNTPILSIGMPLKGKLITFPLTKFDTKSSNQNYSAWASTDPAQTQTYDYFVYLYDTDPTKNSIAKVYGIEIFPKRGANTNCDKERPDSNLSPSHNPAIYLLQVHSGSGGEPNHP